MISLLKRIARQFKRPLPDLYAYLSAKVLSALWRPYLAQVGPGFHVCKGAKFQGGRAIYIGRGFHGGPFLWIEAAVEYAGYHYTPRIDIGDGVVCSHFVHIAATNHVTIGNGVLLGSGVHITDHSHGVYHGPNQDTPDSPPSRRQLDPGQPVVLGENVWLGDGVVVLPGVTIGAGTIVGANSVVTRSLPAGVMAVGAPARPIKRYDSASKQWRPIDESSTVA